MSEKFEFDLGERVEIKSSGEAGEVIGRAEYVSGGIQIQLHYMDGQGCAKTEWFYQNLLASA